MNILGILCGAVCRHGGTCGLPPDHGGQHDSYGRCQWDDADSITPAEGNAILLASGNPMAEILVTLDEMFRGMS